MAQGGKGNPTSNFFANLAQTVNAEVSNNLDTLFGNNLQKKRAKGEDGPQMPPNPFESNQSEWLSVAIASSVSSGVHHAMSSFGEAVDGKF